VSELSSKEAARSFSDVVNRARYAGERTVITCRGKRAAVVVPIADLEQLEGKIATVCTPGSTPAERER